MENDKKKLVPWLNDAYSMEQAQIKMLEKIIGSFDEYKYVQDGLKIHLEQTKEQAEDIRKCLAKLGETPSMVKTAWGKVIGTMQGFSTKPAGDEPVKNMITLQAGEDFEHASYTSLATAARVAGEDEIADTCERIAEQEKITAHRLSNQLPKVVEQFIYATR